MSRSTLPTVVFPTSGFMSLPTINRSARKSKPAAGRYFIAALWAVASSAPLPLAS